MKQQQLAYEIAADQDIFMQIRQSQQGIKIHIYSLKSQPKMKKFTNSNNFVKQDSLLKYVFKDLADLVVYLRQSSNYILNLEEKLIYLNLVVQGKNYGKHIKFPINLIQEELDPVSQNYILRKQINFLKFSRKQRPSLKIEDSQHIQTNPPQQQKSFQLSFSQPNNLSNNLSSISRASSKKIIRNNGNNTKGIQPQKLPVLLNQKTKSNENKKKQIEKVKPRQDRTKKKIINKKLKNGENLKGKEKKVKQRRKQKISPKVKIQQQVQSQKDNSCQNRSRSRQNSNSADSRWLKQKSRIYLGQNIYQITYTNGDSYKGEIKDNAFHGKGQYVTQKYTLIVNWKNGEPDGEGITQYKNGSYQKGIYGVGCKRTGQGEDHYSNGQSYIGGFLNEKKHGLGIYYFQNGDNYNGQWMEDMQHGRGIESFANGSKFEGNWVKDEKHGEGLLSTKHGTIKQIWNRGKLMKQLCQIPEDD